MRLKKSLTYFFLGLNLVFAVFYLLSCCAPYINPLNSSLIALLGLSFPMLLMANIFWVFFWLLFKRRLSLISLITLLISFGNLINYFSIQSCKTTKPDGSITVMSYNVKTFDLYNWNHNEVSKNNMLDLIDEVNPDILCLQEFYTDDSENFNILDRLKENYPYYHFQRTLTSKKYMHWGIVTFSKFPIISKEVINFSNARHNLSITSDIEIGQDTIRVYNAHLQSIHLGRHEYESVQNLGRNNQAAFPFEKFYSKLKLAFIKRAHQAEVLKEKLNQSRLKKIVCADFNDSPNSYTYKIVADGLIDSFKEAGCGMGRTYSGPFPSFRIDFILADRGINFDSHRIIENDVSDHYPIVSSFTLGDL